MPILFNSARSQVVKDLNFHKGFNGSAKACNSLYNITSEVPIMYPHGETLKMKLVTGNEMQLRVLHFICSPNGTILPMTKNFREEYNNKQYNNIDKDTLARLEQYIENRRPRNELRDLFNKEYNWLVYYGSDNATYGVGRYNKFFYMRAEDVIKKIGSDNADEIEAKALEGIEKHSNAIISQIARRKRAEERGYKDFYTTSYLTNEMFATFNEDNTKKLSEKYSLDGWTDWSVLYTIMDFSDARGLSRTDGLTPIKENEDNKPKIKIIKKTEVEEKRKEREEDQKITDEWGVILRTIYKREKERYPKLFFCKYKGRRMLVVRGYAGEAMAYNDLGAIEWIPYKDITDKTYV